MAKFRFRLATLQKLREIHRDELRSKLAEAVQAQQTLDEQIEQVLAETGKLESMRRKAVTTSSINVDKLLEAQRYQGVLAVQQATMREQMRLLVAEVDRRRDAVVEADRQVKILEKLRERKLEEHRRQRQRIETKALDEVSERKGEEAHLWQV